MSDGDHQQRLMAAARAAMDDSGVPYELVSIDGADHVFMRYASQQAVVTHTADWLRRVLLSSDS